MTFEVTLLSEHLHPWVICVTGGWDITASLSVQVWRHPGNWVVVRHCLQALLLGEYYRSQRLVAFELGPGERKQMSRETELHTEETGCLCATEAMALG